MQIPLLHPESFESYDMDAAIDEALQAVEDALQTRFSSFDGTMSWERDIDSFPLPVWSLTFRVFTTARIGDEYLSRVIGSTAPHSFDSLKLQATQKHLSRQEFVRSVEISVYTLAEDVCWNLLQQTKPLLN